VLKTAAVKRDMFSTKEQEEKEIRLTTENSQRKNETCGVLQYN
jgi:hypothetical protein